MSQILFSDLKIKIKFGLLSVRTFRLSSRFASLFNNQSETKVFFYSKKNCDQKVSKNVSKSVIRVGGCNLRASAKTS